MSEVSDLMMAHRSIRKFSDQKISASDFATIIKASKSAATSSFLQCVSIIRITDIALRDDIMALCANQSYIAQAAEFLVFCIDFNQHKTLVPDGHFGYSEQVLLGAIDAGLMGQNALLAAQSLGLGGVFIGAMRNNPDQIAKRLKLPDQVFALFGLCLGYPEQDPQLKPRLPDDILVHNNYYQALDMTQLAQYDQEVRAYYAKRSNGKNSTNWSDDIAAKLAKEARPFIQDCLKKQGFMTVK
ncbi:MAG: oxygen-insensitive NADPH nitroreductase [Francisellaceae bacterium]